MFSVVPPEESAKAPWDPVDFSDDHTSPLVALFDFVPTTTSSSTSSSSSISLSARASSQKPVGSSNERGCEYMSLDRWSNLWRFCAVQNPERTIRFLSYLGYNDGMFDRNYRPGLIARKSIETENGKYIRVLVTGSVGSGKTSLLQRLSGFSTSRHSASLEPVSEPLSTLMVANSTGGGVKAKFYIVFSEVSIEALDKFEFDEKCDVVLVCFDITSNMSLDEAKQIDSILPSDLPRLFIATKVDLDPELALQTSITWTSPASPATSRSTNNSPQTWKDALDYCGKSHLDIPCLFSSVTMKDGHPLFEAREFGEKIVSAAHIDRKAQKRFRDEKRNSLNNSFVELGSWQTTVLVGCFLMTSAAIVYLGRSRGR